MLQENNVDIEKADTTGRNALMWAIETGNHEIAKQIIDKLPNAKVLNQQDKFNNQTAFDLAINKEKCDVAISIINKGYKVSDDKKNELKSYSDKWAKEILEAINQNTHNTPSATTSNATTTQIEDRSGVNPVII